MVSLLDLWYYMWGLLIKTNSNSQQPQFHSLEIIALHPQDNPKLDNVSCCMSHDMTSMCPEILQNPRSSLTVNQNVSTIIRKQ